MKSNVKIRLAVAASQLALGLAAPAMAQQAPAAGADQAADATVNTDDIVVTARRREESLQNVPIAVTAFSSETLRQKSIASQDDLVAHTPSLQLRSNGAQRSDGAFFLRGQGSTYGSQPGVIVYTNEVPDFRASVLGNSTQFYDLENIQVLKGPQGTLFGRSTTGGAILLTTKRPTNRVEGFVEFKAGNYSYRDLTAALNLPIFADKLALRLAGNVVRRDGYTISRNTGQDLDDRNRESYRITLLATPTPWLENETIFRGEHIDEAGTGVILLRYNPTFLSGTSIVNATTGHANFGSGASAGRAFFTAGGLAGAPVPLTIGYAATLNGICAGAAGIAASGSTAQCLTDRTGRITSLITALNAATARMANGGSVRESEESAQTYTRGLSQQLTNITKLTPGALGPLGEITIKNIFATNRVAEAASARSVSGAPLLHATTWNGVDVINGGVAPSPKFSERKFFDNYSNEFQIGGHSPFADWLVGYYKNHFYTPLQMGAIFATFNDAFDTGTPLGVGGIQGAFTLNERSDDVGYFGQATIRPTDTVSLTAGYRWSHFKRTAQNATATLTNAGLVAGTPTAAVPVDQSSSSYNFAIDWKPVSGLLVYATHRKGFKPGGANGTAANLPVGYRANFDPETVLDYELGVKYEWNAGGMGGHVNIAAYHSDYSNVQRNEVLPNGGTVFTQINNIAAAKIDGVEIETIFNIGERLKLGLNYNYTKARYTAYPGVSAVVTNPPLFDSVTGLPYYNTVANIASPYVGTPRHQFSVNARYAVIDDKSTGEIALSGNYYRQSSVYLDDNFIQTLFAEGRQKAYGTLNLRLEWNRAMGSAIDLAVNATNVTQEVYKVANSSLWASLGTYGAIYNEPRMVSFQARYRF